MFAGNQGDFYSGVDFKGMLWFIRVIDEKLFKKCVNINSIYGRRYLEFYRKQKRFNLGF